MDAELTALATAGATALVQQMVTEGWAQARQRVAAFFSRRGGGGEEEALEGELEVSRTELVAAQRGGDEAGEADVEAEWRVRLRRALRDDPAAAEELRRLLAELRPDTEPGVTVRDVHNTMTGGAHRGTVIQAGVISKVEQNGGGSTGGPARG
ncbi:hypothetical protein [Streptomyces rimosus]|uniref:hypothetical protein n=1 Tax=Streptomyces rimosus TaxID=1927 RepID=UPI000518A02D|nr:hypothetical protein [Streptomyces rimosus]